MKTCYFGGWKDNRCYTTKTHICEDDDTPICGAKFARFMTRQIIGMGVFLNHVNCAKCLVRGTAAQRVEDEARRLDKAIATTPRLFFFHYNKPASQRAKKPQISVHWRGACHIVDNIDVRVRCFGRIRNRQPYFVMVGRGVLRLDGGLAIITNK